MRLSIFKASLAIAAYCQVVVGQRTPYLMSEVTNKVDQLNKQALEQIDAIALFDESSREEYLQRQPGPFTTYSKLLDQMFDVLYNIRKRTQNPIPGGEAEQMELTSAYLDMAGAHSEMLEAFADKATALWANEDPIVPPQVAIRLLNYRSSCQNLGNALPKYAPNNATEIRDLAVALDKDFAKMEAAITKD